MKSPWRIIADLTSRGRQSKQTSLPASTENEAEYLDLRAQPTLPQVPFIDTMIPSGSELGRDSDESAAINLVQALDKSHDEETPSLKTIAVKAVAAEAIDSEPLTPITEQVENIALTATLAKKRRKRYPAGDFEGKIDLFERGSDGIATNSLQKPVSKTPLFHEQAVALDEEIAALRLNLAQKLRTQNEQLKNMLGRFERN